MILFEMATLEYRNCYLKVEKFRLTFSSSSLILLMVCHFLENLLHVTPLMV